MENLYAQIDDGGRSSSLLQIIVDHRIDDTAIPKSQGWYKSPTAHTKKRVITIKGWFLQVEWFYGTRTWVPLRELKESNPLEVAEYAKARYIDSESAFAWWVDWALKRRDKIISQIRHRVPKKAMKFCVVVPGSVDVTN